MLKGMFVQIIRSGSDSTNKGVTSPDHGFQSAILVNEPGKSNRLPFVSPIFEVSERHPTLVLREKGGRLCAEPIERPTGVGWMFGGNFIYSSDSRFPNDYPIPVHDRQETKDQYRENSI